MFLLLVFYRNQCRRIALKDPPYSFNSLISEATEKFRMDKSAAELRYKDPFDGDWITLSTDDELLEALQILATVDPPVLHMELCFKQKFLPDPEIGNLEWRDYRSIGQSPVTASSGFRTPKSDNSECEESIKIDGGQSGDGREGSTSYNQVGKILQVNEIHTAAASDAGPEASASQEIACHTHFHGETLAQLLDGCFSNAPRLEAARESRGGAVHSVLDSVASTRPADIQSAAGDHASDSDSVAAYASGPVAVEAQETGNHGHDEALARLMDMGFDDTSRLETLLRLHGGDVDSVLEALLAG